MCLPNITFFEFSFDSASDGLGDDFELVLHSYLRIDWEDVWISPDVVEAVLDAADVACDGAERCCWQVLEHLVNGPEMLADDLSVSAQFFVLLLHHALIFELLPDLDFFKGLKDTSALVRVELELGEVGATFPDDSVETCSKRVE